MSDSTLTTRIGNHLDLKGHRSPEGRLLQEAQVRILDLEEEKDQLVAALASVMAQKPDYTAPEIYCYRVREISRAALAKAEGKENP